MKIKTSAAPPIAAPAMPPGDKAALAAAALVVAAGADVVVLGAEVEDVDEVDEEELLDVGDAVAAADELAAPFGPRFSYAAQSGDGNAKGQLSSWQREYNCGPRAPAGTAGEQRKLYLSFIAELSDPASLSEKP